MDDLTTYIKKSVKTKILTDGLIRQIKTRKIPKDWEVKPKERPFSVSFDFNGSFNPVINTWRTMDNINNYSGTQFKAIGKSLKTRLRKQPKNIYLSFNPLGGNVLIEYLINAKNELSK